MLQLIRFASKIKRKYTVLPTLGLSTALCGCGFLGLGKMPGGNGGGSQSGNATLNLLLNERLPTLSEWLPSLPAEFAQTQGVASATTGLPELAKSQLSTELGASASSLEIDKLLSEAQSISAWGFSESRRLEALLQAAATPLFDLLGEASLFSKLSSQGTALVELGITNKNPLWETLLGNLKFAVALPKIKGLPSHLVLSTSADGTGVQAAGIWTGASSLTTGFIADINMSNSNEEKISLAVAPAMMGAVVPAWSGQSCADDLYAIEIARNTNSGTRQLALRSWECPTTRNTAAHLAVRFDGKTTLVETALAQTFATNTLVGPRKMLGSRQGFVLQAASQPSGAGNAVAAALAVAGESDFPKPLAQLLANFSISSLVTRYVQSFYLRPLITSNTAINLAACNPLTTASSENMSKLCNNEEIDPTLTTSAVAELKTLASSVSLSSIASNLSTIGAILSVKNSMFLLGKNTNYGTAPEPSATFRSLDESRSALNSPTPQVLTSIPTSLQSRFVSYRSAAELPSTELAASSALTNFFGSKCNSLIADAINKTGGSANRASSLCPALDHE